MPDCEIAGVEDAPAEEDSGRGGVFVVALAADVTGEDDLAGFLAIALDVDGGGVIVVFGGLDDADELRRVETMA